MFEGFDYLLLVADEQKRTAVFTTQLPEKGKRLLAVFRIKVPGWFIRKNQFGLIGQRPCQSHSLLLANGKLPRIIIRSGGQTHPVQQILGPSLFYLSRKRRRKQYVLQTSETLEQVE